MEEAHRSGPPSLTIAGQALRGADDQIRTGDPNLGKVVLYQLSYVRNGWPG